MNPTGEFTTRLNLVHDRLAHPRTVPHFTLDFILADVDLNPQRPRRFDNFSGDLSGRYVEAMSLFPTRETSVDLHQLVQQLIGYQREDGRFGRDDLVFEADQIADQHMALLWGNGRLLVGLTTYFLHHGNDDVLKAAQRLGDFLVQTYEACARPDVAQRLEGLGAFGFICFTQLNEGLVLLTRCTGEAHYADIAAGIYPLLPPRGDQHSHGYLTTLRGVMMQYELTGDAKHLDFVVEKYHDLLNSPDFLIWGGVKEYFGEKPLEDRDEGCSEADFLRLSLQLFTATGESFYVEKAESCLLNAFYFNQYETGDFGHHHCSQEGLGFRPNYRHCSWWCCTMHGLRAFRDVQQLAVQQQNNRVRLNLFLDGRFETDALTLQIRKAGATYHVDVQPKMNESVTIAIRIPTWATATHYWLNGSLVESQPEAGYFLITRHWQPADTLTLQFDYRLCLLNEQFAEVPMTAIGNEPMKVAIFYGPYLLVADDQADPTFVAEPLWENILYLNSLRPANFEANSSAVAEAYHRIAYKHQGFPGVFETTLRPMSEIGWGHRGFVMAWLFVVSSDQRDMAVAGEQTNVPAGNYADRLDRTN